MTKRRVLSVAKFLFHHASTSQRRSFALLCVWAIILGFLEMAVAASISLLGVGMSSPETLQKFPIFNRILHYSPFPDSIPLVLQTLMLIMTGVALSTLLKNIFLAYVTWAQHYFSQRVAWDISCKLFSNYLRAPYTWHLQQNSAELQLYLGWRSQIAMFILQLQLTLSQAIIAFFLIGSAFFFSPGMSLILFASIGTLAWCLYRYSKNRAHRFGETVADLERQSARVTMQSLHSINDIIIYNKKEEATRMLRVFVKPHSYAASIQQLFYPLPQWVLESTGLLILLSVLFILAFSGENSATVAGTIMLLAAVSWRLLPAANKALGANLFLRGHLSYIERLQKAFEETPVVEDLAPRNILPFTEKIELSNISFTYPTASSPALKNISLTIPAGKMVGLVGLSGSGKSSLVNVITGLFHPQEGSVLVDGTVLSPQNQCLNIGYVPQHLYLFDASLAENIAFSDWGKEIDTQRLQRSCELASIDFMSNLPKGMETILGERGARLSGGQIQRVGIARALYRDPQLLLFDEATSALDGATENAIQETIYHLRAHMTVVLIAHRLSTVQGCDYIYWIDKGIVRMEGTPDKVLPEYAAFLDAHATAHTQHSSHHNTNDG